MREPSSRFRPVVLFCFLALLVACPLLSAATAAPPAAASHAVNHRLFSSPASLTSSCTELELLSPTLLLWQGSLYSLQSSSSSLSPTTLPVFDDDKALKKEAKAEEKAAKKRPDLDPPGSPEFWFNAAAALVCVLVAALAAGLTVGLVSIDPFDLQVILETNPDDCESEEERRQLEANKEAAIKLLPIVLRHHLLLVTLLLLNSAANETLPLFLDDIVPSWLAVLISVTLVLVFGEILPSAIFTGANQLALAAKLVPLIWVCLVVFSPLSWPIAKLLDWWLGDGSEEPDLYRRSELKALVKLQSTAAHLASHNRVSSTSSSSRRPRPPPSFPPPPPALVRCRRRE